MTEHDLFTGLARRSDPATSHEAARAFVASGKQRSQHVAILRAMLRGYDGATAGELERALGIRAHKRMPELAALGLVYKSGTRECKASGMNATTWRLGE